VYGIADDKLFRGRNEGGNEREKRGGTVSFLRSNVFDIGTMTTQEGKTYCKNKLLHDSEIVINMTVLYHPDIASEKYVLRRGNDKV
jgi:hypothetical protein